MCVCVCASSSQNVRHRQQVNLGKNIHFRFCFNFIWCVGFVECWVVLSVRATGSSENFASLHIRWPPVGPLSSASPYLLIDVQTVCMSASFRLVVSIKCLISTNKLTCNVRTQTLAHTHIDRFHLIWLYLTLNYGLWRRYINWTMCCLSLARMNRSCLPFFRFSSSSLALLFLVSIGRTTKIILFSFRASKPNHFPINHWTLCFCAEVIFNWKFVARLRRLRVMHTLC